MILILSILIFTIQTTFLIAECGSNNNGKANPFRFRKGEKSKTKFHVKGDTAVVKTNEPVSMASTASKAPERPEDKRISQQEVPEEKKTENENGKSQKAEKKDNKKPLISVEPSGELMFKLESESQIRLSFKNISEEKIMFKIKVSDRAYNVNPVFGILEVGEISDVVVTHIPSECKEAKLVVVNSKYAGDIDLAKSFRNSKPTGGPVTIILVAS